MHDEVERIRKKMHGGGFPQLIRWISIDGLRGFKNTRIEFNFPIVAVAGENGAGKTTLIKALASVYEARQSPLSFNPGKFFARTPWDIVKGVQIGASLKLGPNEKQITIGKRTERWRGLDKRVKRDVYLYDISRTLPVDALMGYAQVTKRQVVEASAEDLSPDFRDKLSEVMGRKYKAAKFARTDIDTDKKIGVLARDFGQYSQFHQGSGESLSLDLMSAFSSIPDNALVLIDEIEASLHPKAQRRLMHCLLNLCRVKNWQAIVTTHSPFILEEVPPEARVLLIRNQDDVSIIYGGSVEFCLSSLDDKKHNSVNIAVEDREAAIILREILYKYDPELAQEVGIFQVGPADVVDTLGRLAQAGRLPIKVVAVHDGDKKGAKTVSLPGNLAPERQIFGDLQALQWPLLHERFGVGAGNLHSYLNEAMTISDHHKWCASVGDKIIKGKDVVWDTLVSVWVNHCLAPDVGRQFIDDLRGLIDKGSHNS